MCGLQSPMGPPTLAGFSLRSTVVCFGGLMVNLAYSTKHQFHHCKFVMIEGYRVVNCTIVNTWSIQWLVNSSEYNWASLLSFAPAALYRCTFASLCYMWILKGRGPSLRNSFDSDILVHRYKHITSPLSRKCSDPTARRNETIHIELYVIIFKAGGSPYRKKGTSLHRETP